MMEHNFESVEGLRAKRVVFSCPSYYRTWKEYYRTGFELFHSTQLIEKLIGDGAIRPGAVNATVTYHDLCDLGRNGGVYDAPRQILKSIPGLTLLELENNRTQSVCCGGGGELADPDLSSILAKKKIEEIQRTGADAVVTSCQQCIRTIKATAIRQEVDLNVWDVTELVLQAMFNDYFNFLLLMVKVIKIEDRGDQAKSWQDSLLLQFFYCQSFFCIDHHISVFFMDQGLIELPLFFQHRLLFCVGKIIHTGYEEMPVFLFDVSGIEFDQGFYAIRDHG
jgi:hypothetical protein